MKLNRRCVVIVGVVAVFPIILGVSTSLSASPASKNTGAISVNSPGNLITSQNNDKDSSEFEVVMNNLVESINKNDSQLILDSLNKLSCIVYDTLDEDKVELFISKALSIISDDILPKELRAKPYRYILSSNSMNIIEQTDTLLDKANTLARELKDYDSLAENYYSVAHRQISSFDINAKTKEYLSSAIDIAENNNNFSKHSLSKYYLDMSRINVLYDKDPSLSLVNAQKASNLANTIGDVNIELLSKEIIAESYFLLLKKQECLSYMDDVISERLKQENYLEAATSIDRAIWYSFIVEDEKSFNKYKVQFEDVVSKIDNISRKEYFKSCVSQLHNAMSMYYRDDFKNSLDLIRSIDFDTYDEFYNTDYAKVGYLLTVVGLETNNHDDTLNDAMYMLEQFDRYSNNNSQALYYVYNVLAQAYHNAGDSNKAYTILNKSFNWYISNNIYKLSQESEELHKRYETKLKENEILQLAFENTNKDDELGTIVTATLVISILAGMLAYQYKRTKHFNQTLANLALTDSLTGLRNRRYLDELLLDSSWFIKEYSEVSNPESMNVSAFMIDVDDFKKYNDGYGHSMGDYVLMSVGTALNSLADGDKKIVARYGGEEFTFILIGATKEESEEFADKLVSVVSDLCIPHQYASGSNKFVTISVGISNLDIVKEPITDLINKADIALYHSKVSGKNKYTHIDDL